MKRSTWIRLVTLATVLLLVGVPIASSAATAQSSTSNSSSPVERTGPYELDELRSGGTGIPDMHASWRPLPEKTGAAWVEYYPSGGWVDTSSSDQSRYLEPGTTVRRNELDLSIVRLGNTDQDDITVKIVYWNEKQVNYADGNSSTSTTIVAHQSVQTVNVSLSGTATKATIDLKPHFDGPVQTTMWIEGQESAKWTFKHHSSPTTTAAGVDSAGDQLMWGVTWILIPGLVSVLVGSGVGRISNRRTLAGPGKGLAWWAIVLVMVTFLVVVAAWTLVANVLTTAPLAMTVVLFIAGFVQQIEIGSQTPDTVLIDHPSVAPTQSATGEPGVEMIEASAVPLNVCEDRDGREVVILDGIREWFKRLIGVRAYLEVDGADEIRTAVDHTEGPYDRRYYADPLADDMVDWQPPAWIMEMPDLTKRSAATAIGLCGVGVLVGQGLMGSPWLGATLVAIPVTLAGLLTVQDPHAVVTPAPIHMGDAHAAQMTLAGEYSAVKTVDEANEKLVEERARRRVLAEAETTETDQTLVKETLGFDESDVDDVEMDRESVQRMLEDSDQIPDEADNRDFVERLLSDGGSKSD